MITFETQCYEGDYLHLLTGDRLQQMIENCGYSFERKVVIINNVQDRDKVAALAEDQKKKGIIDDYYFASDYEKEMLEFFEMTKESFKGGYYFSSAEFVGIYLCKTPYLLHFTSDAMIAKPSSSDWITDGIQMMKNDPKYVCVNPFWADRAPRMEDGFDEELDDWFVDCGFSDQCHLIPMSIFRNKIYNEHHRSEYRYPSYTGQSIERRIYSYMKNHGLRRLTSKHVSYLHQNFVKPGIKPWVVEKMKSVRNIFSSLSHKRHLYEMNGKVYDIFTFFNELELLEIRLNILDPYVDYFVIVECTETFSGKPKELYYEKNKERFAKWQHKIIHYVTSDVPKDPEDLRRRLEQPDLSSLDRQIIEFNLTSDNIPPGETHWFKEFYQKESIKQALLGLKDDDICFVSDVDEIWNPHLTFDPRKKETIFRIRQLMYVYYLNNRSSERWAGSLMTRYANIKNACLNHLRTPRKTKYTYIKDGGWHFTNIGGADRIRTKLESYGHQEFNNAKIKDDLEQKIASNTDFIGRRFHFWIDETNLPEYIINNKAKYKNLFK